MSSEPTTLSTVVQLYPVLQTLLGIEGKIEEGGSATCDFAFRRKPTNSMPGHTATHCLCLCSGPFCLCRLHVRVLSRTENGVLSVIDRCCSG